MEHEAALAFFNFALYHGIVIDNRRLIPKLKKEDPHKVAEAAFPPDTTRCVYLSDLDDPQNAVHQIRAELRNLNLSASLERITLSPSRYVPLLLSTYFHSTVPNSHSKFKDTRYHCVPQFVRRCHCRATVASNAPVPEYAGRVRARSLCRPVSWNSRGGTGEAGAGNWVCA